MCVVCRRRDGRYMVLGCWGRKNIEHRLWLSEKRRWSWWCGCYGEGGAVYKANRSKKDK